MRHSNLRPRGPASASEEGDEGTALLDFSIMHCGWELSPVGLPSSPFADPRKGARDWALEE
jgi:hypothetical protein